MLCPVIYRNEYINYNITKLLENKDVTDGCLDNSKYEYLLYNIFISEVYII